jgi:peroxiredoxin
LGQAAPDFVVPNLENKESVRLRRYFGKPILLVFYSPTSKFGEKILSFVQKEFGDPKISPITVISLAMSDDADGILTQRNDWHLTFPILSGQGLRLTYAVEATPKFVVIDGTGIVRGAYVGWGMETPNILKEELQRWKPTVNRK